MLIFKHELRSNFKSLLIWSATMVFLVFAGMMKYSAYEKTGEAVNALFNQMPPAMLKIMGIDPNGDLSTVAVFYSIFYLYFILLAAVHALTLGVTVIGKEERDHTAEFLLVKPIERWRILTEKIGAAFVQIMILNLVTFISSVIGTAPFNNNELLSEPIAYVCLGLFMVQWIFLGIGLLLSGFIHKSKTASGIGTGILLSSFVLKMMIDLNDDLQPLTFLSPFRYFSGSDLMLKQVIPSDHLILAICISLITIGLAVWGYQRRDIHN